MKTYFLDDQSALQYLLGEKAGRQDGASRWGQRDTRKMSEAQAMGYRDGYAVASCH